MKRYLRISGPVGYIIYAVLYGSVKIKFTVSIPMRINKDLFRSIRINSDQYRFLLIRISDQYPSLAQP